uniref:NAD(+) ADP-ribosyltransferase n=1 Tax=Setaria digitata TaxID=48799 RepID=A0A915PUP7_9BILA
MAGAVRSVRFSDDLPRICHNTTARSHLLESYEETCEAAVQLPRIYDDALFSPYDIYTAASMGDVPAQLESGYDANRLNGSGWSSLMYAAYLGHEAVCALLLKSGALVDLCNPNGQTALMLAATCGNLAVVRLLMRKDAVIDKQDNMGDTALAYATACSQTSVAEALLDNGANPNIPNLLGMTPTLTACCIGHELTLLALLQNNGDPKLKNAKGEDGEALAFDNPKAIAILRDPPPSKKKKNSTIRKTMEVNSLTELLSRLKLEKYIETFENENIDLNLFLELNDSDLMEIGIKAFGPRKKMLNVIQQYRTDGTLILCTNDAKPVPYPYVRERGQSESHSQQVTTELMECQQRLAECQHELKQARNLLNEHRSILNSISEACRHSRKIAYAMLEEVRQANGTSSAMEKDVIAVIKNIDNILMRMLELPQQ